MPAAKHRTDSDSRVVPPRFSLSHSSASSSEDGHHYQHQSNGHRRLTLAPSTASSSSSQSAKTASCPTAYERAVDALQNDEGWAKEIALGKRVGFYRLRGELGSGNFSQVKIAVHCITKDKVAVKTLDKTKLDQKTQKMLSREIAVMEQLCHPHIVQLFEVIETLSKVHLVLECAPGGELCTKITNDGKMAEDRCRSIFSQLVSAVDYMHSLNVIHRDIKSENVFFLDEDTIKVGDFGFSTILHSTNEHLETFCGSPPYAAPELFQDESYVGTAVDIWAMGILLYFMVTGYMPFRAQTVINLKRLILEENYQLPSHVSLECGQLLEGILRKKPKERLKMLQIIDSSWLSCRRRPSESEDDGAAKWTNQRLHSSGKSCNSLSMYHPWPRMLPEMRTKLEIVTRRQMALFGITDTMINENVKKGSHHPVMGIYRILIHSNYNRSVQCTSDVSKTSSSESMKSEEDANDDRVAQIKGQSGQKGGTVLSKSKTKKMVMHKKSRTCVVL